MLKGSEEPYCSKAPYMVKEKSLSVRKEQGNRGNQCICNSDGRGRDEASWPADVSFWGI